MRSTASLAALLAAACLANAAVAQTFPSRQITLVVPSAPAGPIDLLARGLATSLAPRIGQSVVVENRPGAGTYLGGEQVARSAPDGHTLLVNSLGGLQSDLFVKNQPAVLSRDLIAIAPLAEGPVVLITHGAVPANDLREFIAYVRANPKKLNVAVFPATTLYLDMVRFMRANGMEMIEIPYNSSASIMTAMAAGDVHLYFSSPATPKPFIEQGRIKALAMGTPERFYLEPNIRTAKEQGFDVNISNLYVVLGPAKTPPAAVALLNRRVAEAMDTPEAKQMVRNVALSPVTATPEQLAARFAAETRTYREVAAAIGVTPQ